MPTDEAELAARWPELRLAADIKRQLATIERRLKALEDRERATRVAAGRSEASVQCSARKR